MQTLRLLAIGFVFGTFFGAAALAFLDGWFPKGR